MNYARGALDVIRLYGWCKGDMGDDHSGYCIGGALWKAGARDMNNPMAGEAHAQVVQRVIADQYPDRYDETSRFAAFNDHEDTTQEDAERVLEKAAVLIDEVLA